jgi:D-alanyl-D-alanine carboxypeptidase (penicillin-binding protein 5/6)
MFRPLLLTALFLPTIAASNVIETEAPHAIIVDHETGLVLFEKDAREPMPPASMTKIMTAFMVFEALERGDITEQTQFTVSEEAWRRGGIQSGSSTMFLDVGSEAPVIALLRGVIIQSGNDACIVLAEGLAGSEEAFARRMTERARELGLESSTFLNATGWPDEGHEISAADLSRLATMLIERFPQYYSLYSERSFEWNGITQSNRNPLLGRFTGADGVKTGATSVSGYGLVGSAMRDGVRRTIVINGLDDQRARQSAAVDLMEKAFRDFIILDLFDTGDAVSDVDVYIGKQDRVGAQLREDVQIAIARHERDNIEARVDYQVATAPIEAGDKIAELVVSNSGKEIGRYPLYATQAVARKGFFGRVGTALTEKIRG